MATVILKGGASPALTWTVDDGASSGPTKGTGSNGGNVNYIQLHEGVNTGVSLTAVALFLASAAARTIRGNGGDIHVRA